MQNTIFRNKDNPVIVEFTFSGDFEVPGLTAFARLVLTIGSESYSTSDDPTKLYIEGTHELVLDIGSTTSLETGAYGLTIVGYSNDYPSGYILSNSEYNRLPKVIVR